mmetsp:Transcript_42014/g.68155  ORF Transcript_42014/g.68155 Transcript_42014/m.68155 type:complete len:120 (+) Transcript_42014:132-491(+)
MQIVLVNKIYTGDINDKDKVYLTPAALSLIHYYEFEVSGRRTQILDWECGSDKCPRDVCQTINIYADLMSLLQRSRVPISLPPITNPHPPPNPNIHRRRSGEKRKAVSGPMDKYLKKTN